MAERRKASPPKGANAAFTRARLASAARVSPSRKRNAHESSPRKRCAPYMMESVHVTHEEAVSIMGAILPHLKRWQD